MTAAHKMSDPERAWLTHWNRHAPRHLSDALKMEFRFHDTRKWRFDFAHVASLVAVEIEGGTYTKGRHVRGKGFADDCEKYNAASLAGWRVFRLTPQMVEADPVGVVAMVAAAIEKAP